MEVQLKPRQELILVAKLHNSFALLGSYHSSISHLKELKDLNESLVEVAFF